MRTPVFKSCFLHTDSLFACALAEPAYLSRYAASALCMGACQPLAHGSEKGCSLVEECIHEWMDESLSRLVNCEWVGDWINMCGTGRKNQRVSDYERVNG